MDEEKIISELKMLVDRTATETDAQIYEGELESEGLKAIRLVGQTADFFGGFEGMTRLHDAFEKAGGNTYKLNRFWDMIGGWCA